MFHNDWTTAAVPSAAVAPPKDGDAGVRVVACDQRANEVAAGGLKSCCRRPPVCTADTAVSPLSLLSPSSYFTHRYSLIRLSAGGLLSSSVPGTHNQTARGLPSLPLPRSVWSRKSGTAWQLAAAV